jgi:hypothetical protein
MNCASQRSRFPSPYLNHAFSQNTPAIRRGRFIAPTADLSAPRGLARHPSNLLNCIIGPPWLSCYPLIMFPHIIAPQHIKIKPSQQIRKLFNKLAGILRAK